MAYYMPIFSFPIGALKGSREVKSSQGQYPYCSLMESGGYKASLVWSVPPPCLIGYLLLHHVSLQHHQSLL